MVTDERRMKDGEVVWKRKEDIQERWIQLSHKKRIKWLFDHLIDGTLISVCLLHRRPYLEKYLERKIERKKDGEIEKKGMRKRKKEGRSKVNEWKTSMPNKSDGKNFTIDFQEEQKLMLKEIK